MIDTPEDIMMPNRSTTLVSTNGDCLHTPGSTVNAFWAALSAGADALALNVFLTQDDVPVCAPSSNLKDSCGEDIEIRNIGLVELQKLDAGSQFRSRLLDEEYQATSTWGDDNPWQGLTQEPPLKNRKQLFHPSLKQTLELFGRRTHIYLIFTHNEYDDLESLITRTFEIVNQFGLCHVVTAIGDYDILKKIHHHTPKTPLCLLITKTPKTDDLDKASSVHAKHILVDYEQYQTTSPHERDQLAAHANTLNLAWHFFSEKQIYAPSKQTMAELEQFRGNFFGWHSAGILAASQAFSPSYAIFNDNLQTKALDENYWAAGYSHLNLETELSCDNGFIISINEGNAYSGGAAICLLPIQGDFDAEVSFHVENPHQATTFELAAIGIDPGYHHMCNEDLSSRTVNLTFDVHGAPPYASSERDQNDGFRCGWNNSFNFAKFGDSSSSRPDKDWLASSANMFNKYGRDVGDGSQANPLGKLRLIRRGPLFSSYYQDKHNLAWVCSGTMLVQSLPETAYLRLAAKHWHKIDPAPANRITFKDFCIKQRAVKI